MKIKIMVTENYYLYRLRIGYDLSVMRQSACLVLNPITVDNFAALFNCTPVDRASDSMMARPKAIHFVCCLVHRGSTDDFHRGSTDDFLLLQLFSGVVWQTRDLHLSRNTLYLLSPLLASS